MIVLIGTFRTLFSISYTHTKKLHQIWYLNFKLLKAVDHCMIILRMLHIILQLDHWKHFSFLNDCGDKNLGADQFLTKQNKEWSSKFP